MGYRAWPAALLTGAALAAASVVVGEQVVPADNHCRGSVAWFTATPVAGTASPVTASLDAKSVPIKIGIGRTATADPVGQTGDEQRSDEREISGCLDVDRIEIPAPAPASDGRA